MEFIQRKDAKPVHTELTIDFVDNHHTLVGSQTIGTTSCAELYPALKTERFFALIKIPDGYALANLTENKSDEQYAALKLPQEIWDLPDDFTTPITIYVHRAPDYDRVQKELDKHTATYEMEHDDAYRAAPTVAELISDQKRTTSTESKSEKTTHHFSGIKSAPKKTISVSDKNSAPSKYTNSENKSVKKQIAVSDAKSAQNKNAASESKSEKKHTGAESKPDKKKMHGAENKSEEGEHANAGIKSAPRRKKTGTEHKTEKEEKSGDIDVAKYSIKELKQLIKLKNLDKDAAFARKLELDQRKGVQQAGKEILKKLEE